MNDPLVDLGDAYDQVRFLQDQGHNEEALALVLRLIDPAENLLGPDHPDLAELHATVGILCRRTGRYELAAQHQHHALEIRQACFGEADDSVAATLNNLGVLYQVMERFAEASEYYGRALAIRAEILEPNDPSIALTRSNLAVTLLAQERLDEAEVQLLAAAATIDQAEALDWRAVEVYSSLGGLYGRTSRHDLALAPLTRALAIARTMLPAGHYQLLDRHADVGRCLSRLGRYDDAREELAAAAAGYESQYGSRDERTIAALTDLAEAHHRVGALADAEDVVQGLIDGTAPGTEQRCKLLNMLGTIHREMGKTEESRLEYEEAVRIYEEHLDPQSVLAGGLLCSLASLHREQRRYGVAAEMFERAISLLRPSENEILAQALNNYAVLALETDDLSMAESLIDECISLYEEKGYAHRDVNLARLRGNLGELRHVMGDYEAAEKLLTSALDGAGALFGPAHPNTTLALVNLARLFVNTGRVAAALPLLSEAATADEQTLDEVFSSSTAAERAELVEVGLRNSSALLTLVTAHLSDSTAAARVALEVMLRRKALLSEALIAQRSAAAGTQVLDELARVSRDLSTAIMRPADNSAEVEELTAEVARLERRLARETDGGELLSRLASATADTLVAALGPNQTLIEYVRFPTREFTLPAWAAGIWGEDHYAAFVVSQTPSILQLIDLGPAEPIDELIDGFREAVARGQDGVYGIERGADDKALDDFGTRLRAAILDPLKETLGHATEVLRHLIVAPDDKLSNVPFAALPVGPRQYLLDQYIISYVSTGRRLTQAKQSMSHHPPVVVADPAFDHPTAPTSDDDVEVFMPLPDSRVEGEVVAALLDVEPVFGADATTSMLLSTSRPRILHIASHAYFLPDETEIETSRSGPLVRMHEVTDDETIASEWFVLGRVGDERFAASGVFRHGALSGLASRATLARSGIALAGANTWLRGGRLEPDVGAGLLTAEDVASMDLHGTEMVVLSACETGLGQVSRSDGILGLRWACVIAGAQSLVMSLWKVPDAETLPFMETFYGRLLVGESRAASLRAAALALRSTHPDPYFWGAFILEGDPAPLQQSGGTSRSTVG